MLGNENYNIPLSSCISGKKFGYFSFVHPLPPLSMQIIEFLQNSSTIVRLKKRHLKSLISKLGLNEVSSASHVQASYRTIAADLTFFVDSPVKRSLSFSTPSLYKNGCSTWQSSNKCFRFSKEEEHLILGIFYLFVFMPHRRTFNSRDILLVCFYAPPNSSCPSPYAISPQDRYLLFEEIFTLSKSLYSTIVYCDLNLPDIDWHDYSAKNPGTQKFVDLISFYNFHQIIDFSTAASAILDLLSKPKNRSYILQEN